MVFGVQNDIRRHFYNLKNWITIDLISIAKIMPNQMIKKNDLMKCSYRDVAFEIRIERQCCGLPWKLSIHM